MREYDSPAPLIRPRTSVPVKQPGMNLLVPACFERGHQVHLVTGQRFTVRNPETGQPMRLNGKPYELSVALCGTFGEWLDGVMGRGQCPICAAVLEERGGMKAPEADLGAH